MAASPPHHRGKNKHKLSPRRARHTWSGYRSLRRTTCAAKSQWRYVYRQANSLRVARDELPRRAGGLLQRSTLHRHNAANEDECTADRSTSSDMMGALVRPTTPMRRALLLLSSVLCTPSIAARSQHDARPVLGKDRARRSTAALARVCHTDWDTCRGCAEASSSNNVLVEGGRSSADRDKPMRGARRPKKRVVLYEQAAVDRK